MTTDSTLRVFGTAPSGVACRDRPAAYVVVFQSNGNVAAVGANVRGREELWLPGGGMHAGESPAETVLREVREELARGIVLRRNLGTAIQYFHSGTEGWYKMTAHFFSGEFSGPVAGQGEHELQWVDLAAHAADFFHECHVWAVTQAAN